MTAVTVVLWYERRLVLDQTGMYPWLMWNLFLALIPYALASITVWWARSAARLRWLAVMPGVLWLVFFPNASYLITDVVHLDAVPEHLWYDMLLLSSLALTGVALSIASLHMVHATVRAATSRVVGWVFAALATYLCAVGVYLGRFLRWNSWDMVDDAHRIIADVHRAAAGSAEQPRFMLFTVAFAAVQFALYTAYARKRNAL